MRTRPFPATLAPVAALTIGLLLGTTASAQVIVKAGDTIDFRFGMLLQGTADWMQDVNSGGYSENMLLRRVRFIVLANVTKNVSIFYQTDNPRAGNAGGNGSKIVNTGFVTQDAYVEWKVAGEALMLDGGSSTCRSLAGFSTVRRARCPSIRRPSASSRLRRPGRPRDVTTDSA